MLFKDLILLLLIVPKLIITKHHHIVTDGQENIVSISSILGTRLVLYPEVYDQQIDSQNSETILWYKGIVDLKLLINRHDVSIDFTESTQSHYHIVNRTKLIIEKTLIGDEGFYTLKIQTDSNIFKQYFYHVVLFSQNLTLSISPSSYQQITYYSDQKINFTCSISLFADRTYIEQSRSLFLSIWKIIIYNNDPDYYQLFFSSSSSYTYIAYLFNYELNQNDHNQTISCALIQQKLQQIILLNITLLDVLNIEYKAYLRGNYYFIRSFNAHSSIEINCEEFNANPKPVYTLIWILNGENRILLNKTKHGRYLIDNATWRNRGNYTCFAENYLNNHQPAHQSFRLNIWFNEHQLILSEQTKIFALQQQQQQQLFQFSSIKSIILILLILIFIFACLFFIVSFYCFCLQFNQRIKS